MKTINSFISISDMFDFLKRIAYIEDKTVDKLLEGLKSDLKGDQSVDNLKALNYFIIFRTNSQDISTYPYENVIHECIHLLKCVSNKDATVSALMGSLIENCLPLIKKDNFNNIFLELLEFVETHLLISRTKQCDNIDNDSELTVSLHVLEKICSFIYTSSANDIKIPYSLTTTIVNLIPELTIEASRKIFVSVLPKFILSQDTNMALEQIWFQLVKFYANESDVEKPLFYICLLCNNYISISHSKTTFPLHDKSELWEIVQKGLYSENSLIRKQSLYILKRYIETLGENDQSIKQNNFYWDSKHKLELIEFWNKLFILLEVLEEKQTHLITPALMAFNDLYVLCLIDKSCYSWLYCVFIRLLNHPSLIILRWTLKEFCNLDVGLLLLDSKFKDLLHFFFNSLNNMFLFNSENNSIISDFNHEDFLVKWLTAISVKDSTGKAFECVLESLANISWSTIPLFYLTSAISKVPPKPLLNTSSLSYFNNILNVTLKNQCIFIRSAVQCRLLQCICHLLRNSVDIMAITNTLGLFCNKESLKRGTDIWKKCVEWIERIPPNEITIFLRCCSDKIFKTNDILDITTQNSMQSLARMLVLMADSDKFSIDGDIRTIVNSISEQFYECEKRMYSCSETQDNCLHFLECLISECSTLPHCNVKEHKLLQLIEHQIPDLLSYIETRLQKGLIDSLQIALLYERTLNGILSTDYLANSACTETLKLFKTTLHLPILNVTPFQEYLSVKIIYLYYNFVLKNTKLYENILHDKEIIQIMFKKRLFSKDLSNIISVDPLFNMRGKLVSELMHTLWSTFALYLDHNKDISYILTIFPSSMLIEFAFDAINEDGKQSLIPILKSFVYLLPHHKNVEDVKRFISSTWNACFELRKNELFWFAINEWMRMVFQDGIAGNIDHHELINDYAKQIFQLGEELTGLVDIFVDHCRNISFIPEFSAIISRGLVFGTILRKDKRMELEVCYLIMKQIETGSMESFGSGKILKTDREVRLKVLNLLLSLSIVETRNQLIVCVVNELLLWDNELTKNNKRYFNDSLIHRQKNKLLQALLIIENYIFLNPSKQCQELPEMIYNWILKSLINSSQQPSIRYQLEWLFVRLNLHYPIFLNLFWKNFSKAGNERLGSMCSFISIAYHLSLVLNDNQFLEQCIDNILPWCMSQNFNIRLYAQVLLNKLWNLYPEISKKYHCITKNQWKIYEQEGNMLVNAKKMEHDFYFSVFHSLKHFTLQTIFWDLSRLSNISVEEWIHPDFLKQYKHLCIQNDQIDASKLLESCESPTWIIKNSGTSGNIADGSSIQKKFIPWKGMFQEQEEINHQKGGLILVASLVEKAANLGGLARTCEVFAAKELIVSNLDVTKEKEFVSLSMTAEKHTYITEVKAHNLGEYLKAMKNMGYMLIGAEQTTGSMSLTNYKFPGQCVLLLGSEKEGIPPNLLPLLDSYIEIPQLGLVRSLNVHVTGAIFLWEYSRQHLLDSS